MDKSSFNKIEHTLSDGFLLSETEALNNFLINSISETKCCCVTVVAKNNHSLILGENLYQNDNSKGFLKKLSLKFLKLVLKLIFLLSITNYAHSADYFQFKKMWPSVIQPWYFYSIGATAYDAESNTFVVMDKSNGLITRLTLDGNVVNRWGGKGTGQGQFLFDSSFEELHSNNMDIDSNGNIYITDPYNHRVQKFSYSGKFLDDFIFEEESILSVAISKNGILAILFPNKLEFFDGKKRLDTWYLDKEYSDLVFMKGGDDFYLISYDTARKYNFKNKSYDEWNIPYYIAVDFSVAMEFPITNISVDEKNNLVFSVTASGMLYTYNEKGEQIYKKKHFRSREDFILNSPVENTMNYARQTSAFFIKNNSLLIFDQFNTFVTLVDINSEIEVKLGVSVSEKYNNTGYPLFWFNDKKRKFSTMVSDKKINIFDDAFNLKSSYNFQLGSLPTIVMDATFSSDGNIILALQEAESKENYIVVFSLDSLEFTLIFSLDQIVNTDSKVSIDADNFGNIFLTTTDVFSTEPIKLFRINTVNSVYDYGDLDVASFGYDDIAILSKSIDNSYIYVHDSYSKEINEFLWENDKISKTNFSFNNIKVKKITTSDNTLILIDEDFNLLKIKDQSLVSKVKIGSHGVGYMNYSDINDVSVLDNEVYITEAINKRLQILQIKNIPDRSKTVIVAGGDQSGNALWDETQANANHAFQTLANQGYTKDNIHYLNRNTDLDLDGNGKPDDVDGLPTRANVKAALTQWAKDAEDMVLYLVGHGGHGTFQLGGGEILTATELRAWLDELQAVMPGKVTVIYDACESGSFQKPLSGSSYPRTVITSTSAKALESAYFQDAISFSHLFWNEVFFGKTVSEAFQTTQTSISQAFGSQSPQMDSDGDGITNTANDYNVVAQQSIGNGTVYSGTAPTIGSVGLTPVGKGESTSTLTAYNISDDKGVQSAWAIVRPPYANLGQDGKPVQNLPRVDLAKQSDGSYQGQFDGFEQPGTYQVIVYAQDQEGNTSLPVVETLNVISPLSRKAVLVAGVDASGQFTQDIQAQTDHALSALTGQGYTDNSVTYLSASTVATTGVDYAASKDGLESALTEWAAETTSDLVVYLVGDIINGQYRVSATESLSLTELDQWLDQVQMKIKGTLTVIHEGNYAGNLVAQLTTPANASRIVVSSSALDQGSYVMGGGDLSFSRYFWNKVAQGGNVADAFAAGEASMRRYQTPQINSNGNVVSNEKDDRYQARFHNLGTGILLAADEPVIGNVPANTTLSGTTHNTLWADGVVSLSSPKKVWAVIEPPGYDPASQQTGSLADIPLQNIGGGRWQADFAGFNRAGVYAVHYYAKDANNRISPPRTSYVTQTRGADAYEDDGSFNSAHYLSSTTGKQQWHNFHQQDDVDYIRFEADPSQGQYTLKVDSQGSGVDTAFSLYDANHDPISLGVGNQYAIDGLPGNSVELAYWLPASTGSYYLKVSPADQGSTGITGGYSVSVFPTNAPHDAVVQGVVKNEAGSPVVGATIYSSSNHQTTTDVNGHYSLPLKQGENSLTVEASGYENNTLQLTVRAEDKLTEDFALLLVAGNNKPEATVSENTTGSIGTADGNSIQDMYLAYYGRPADAGGLDYWVKDLSTYHDLHKVLSSFGRAPEYIDRFGHYSDTELVNAIYQRLFNRDAEPEGLDYWVGTLRNGSSSLVEIALQVVGGAQRTDKQIIANKREVANAYTKHLRNGTLPPGLKKVEAARELLDGVDETMVSVSASLGRMKQ